MTEFLDPIARFLADSREVSGDRFRRDEFAALLAGTFAELCAGCEVVVEIDGDGVEPAVRVGPPQRAAHLDESGPAVDAADRAAARVSRFELADRDARIGVVTVFAPHDAAPLNEDLLTSFARLTAAHLEGALAVEAVKTRAEQLEIALQSRVIIEQAKGMVAQYRGISVELAFTSLRAHARGHHQQLRALCVSVTTGDTPVSRIAVVFSAMHATRRRELRASAIERWRQNATESRAHVARASAATARSAELRVELDHRRALRATEALGRSIDRHLRQASGGGPAGRNRPTVLIGDEREPTRAFVLDTLGREGRLELVGTTVTGADALGRSIVEQPDLLILGLDMEVVPGGEFIAELRRFCPDSRTLVVVADEQDIPRVRRRGANAAVVCGDVASLTSNALELCGVWGAR